MSFREDKVVEWMGGVVVHMDFQKVIVEAINNQNGIQGECGLVGVEMSGPSNVMKHRDIES